MKRCPACLTELSDGIKTCTKCGYGFDSTLGSDETAFAQQEEAAVSVNTVIDGRYQVVRELGRGGMGYVYLVKDTRLQDRLVALKMIHPSFVRHEEARKRFEQEVSTSLDLLHTNIIRVHHLASNSDQHYFTMEYVEGKSLREHIDERKQLNHPFSLAETLAIINPLLDALSYAHKYTIHRDIKPENIMISGEFPDVQVKILDFGIAKTLSKSRLTQTAQSMGTAYYMAPEQMIGAREIDQRADLYSVGMILYEMLTLEMAVGRFKLPGELIAELPSWLDDLAERLLAPRPEDRYQRAAEVKAVLTSMGLESARQEEERKAKEEHGLKIRELLAQGDTYLELRRWDEAEESFSQVLALDGAPEEARVKKGMARKQKLLLASKLEAAGEAEGSGNLKQAISLLEEVLVLSLDKNGIMERQAALRKRLKEEERHEEVKRESEESRRRAEEEEQRHPEEVESRRAQMPVAEEKSGGNNFLYLCGGLGGGLIVLIVIMWILLQLKPNRQEPDPTIPPAQKDTTTESGIELVSVPGGCFQMGDTFGDGEPNEKPVQEVCVDSFRIGKYEVTKGQWRSVMGNNPSNFKNGDNYPVEQVSWEDVQEFIKKLNAKTGKKYRLPTEAEWEYAARSGGKKEKYAGGNDADRVAWHNMNSGNTTHPVGSKSPNGLGIYDMSGNVGEWCQDWYGEKYYTSSPRNNNPHGPSSGSDRVIRGGTWEYPQRYLRSAFRSSGDPGTRINFLGFRLALSAQ